MEHFRLNEDLSHRHLFRRLGEGVIGVIRFIGQQLDGADLSPHEGWLRLSGMPVERMGTPDYPPMPHMHDDTF